MEYGEFLGDELRVDIAADDGDVIQAGDMRFTVLYLPGHTRCSVGYYCEQHRLLLSSETIGVYDGKELIVPSYLVSYSDSINSINRVCELQIDKLLSPHLGILDEQQTRFFLQNCRSSNEKAAMFIKGLLEQGITDDEIIARFKEIYWQGYIRDIYPEDAVNLNTSIMIGLIRKELIQP